MSNILFVEKWMLHNFHTDAGLRSPVISANAASLPQPHCYWGFLVVVAGLAAVVPAAAFGFAAGAAAGGGSVITTDLMTSSFG